VTFLDNCVNDVYNGNNTLAVEVERNSCQWEAYGDPVQYRCKGSPGADPCEGLCCTLYEPDDALNPFNLTLSALAFKIKLLYNEDPLRATYPVVLTVGY